MATTTIYFAGAIRGGRDDAALYRHLIQHLQLYGTVLTEHIGKPELSSSGEEGGTDTYIHDRDLAWLLQSTVVVAEVTTPSLGVGYELGRVVERNTRLPEHERTPVLCLFRPEDGRRLSAMITGAPGIVVREYRFVDEAYGHIGEFFQSLSSHLPRR